MVTTQETKKKKKKETHFTPKSSHKCKFSQISLNLRLEKPADENDKDINM